uniref:7TM_GPCR_Srx domain-containing protein n=1 Tax=Caenorhabditis japonica TaxID=281687 RepID=A0A8R1EMB5_CAEJA
MKGLSELEKQRRRKKFKLTFIQSVAQDLLQVIDISNYAFISKLVDQFLVALHFFVASLFSLVYVLDGYIQSHNLYVDHIFLNFRAVMMYFYSKFNRLNSIRGRMVSSVSIGIQNLDFMMQKKLSLTMA